MPRDRGLIALNVTTLFDSTHGVELASFDSGDKHETLPYLIRLHDEGKVPMVYVSHTAAEVRTASGGLALLDGADADESE